MRKLLCVLLSSMVLSSYAWSDQSTMTTTNPSVRKVKKCLFPNSKKRAPVWVCNAHADGMVAAVGSATKSKAGLSFMEQMAVADARTHLVQNLRESVQPKVAGSGVDAANKNTNENGAAEITKIANESLEGTKIFKRIYGPNGTLYVLIGIDEISATKLREAISAKEIPIKSTE